MNERERIVQLFFFGFLALIAYEMYALFEPFLTPIAWAILLAFLVHPALVELHRFVKNRTTSALILNQTKAYVDVVFDREINLSTINATNVSNMLGPIGQKQLLRAGFLSP